MSDDLTPHQRFSRRLGSISPGDSLAEVLEKTGLDQVEATGGVGKSLERQQLFDATTGERVELMLYQGTIQRPPDYPTDWPFLPDIDCVFVVTSVDEQEHWALYWLIAGEDSALLQVIEREMASLDWIAQAAPKSALDPRVELLRWYYKANADWLTLSRTELLDQPVLALSQRRVDLYPPRIAPNE